MSSDAGSNETPSPLEWHCLRTQKKREHIAASFLHKIADIEVFSPRISQIKKTRAGKKRFIEAMFPSYIFAKFRFPEQSRMVMHSHGVINIVQNGDRRVVPESIISELKVSIPEDIIEAPDPSIEPGTEIEVLTGSLKGLNGRVIAQLPAKNRVEILLDFLGREITVAVDPDDIHLAND